MINYMVVFWTGFLCLILCFSDRDWIHRHVNPWWTAYFGFIAVVVTFGAIELFGWY